MWMVPEGSEEIWCECTSTYTGHTSHIGSMVSFKNGAVIISLQRYSIITWKDTDILQYVQPKRLFLIQNFKHLLNVIQRLGPLKHSTEMSGTDFTSHQVCGSGQSYASPATILFFNASEMILALSSRKWRGSARRV